MLDSIIEGLFIGTILTYYIFLMLSDGIIGLTARILPFIAIYLGLRKVVKIILNSNCKS